MFGNIKEALATPPPHVYLCDDCAPLSGEYDLDVCVCRPCFSSGSGEFSRQEPREEKNNNKVFDKVIRFHRAQKPSK